MKKLFLLRHAHALKGAQDFDRELSLEGIEKARSLNQILCPYSEKIDLIMCSSSVRTSSTARIALPENPIHYSRDYYNSTPTKLLEYIQNITINHEFILLVSHNPAISELASELSSEMFFLKPGGLVLLQSTAENWYEVGSSNTRLINYWA